MRKLKYFSVLLLLIGFYSSADAAVLCSNAGGAVFVRATVCRPGETQLDPVALGLKGPAGSDGADGVSGYEIKTEAYLVAPGSYQSASALCPAGKVAVGGGVLNSNNMVTTISSMPFFDDTAEVGGWFATFFNANTVPEGGSVRVACATMRDETA